MQLELSVHARRAHAEILQRTSEAALLVSLEVVHGNHDVRIRYGRAYLGRWTERTSARHFTLVRTLEPVRDYNVRMCTYPVESVFHSRIKMIYGIGASS